MSLKFTGKLCVIAMKNDEKFEEELTCQFQNYMINLTNLDPSTQKSQKLHFGPKYIVFVLKKSTEELCLMTLNIDAKFE